MHEKIRLREKIGYGFGDAASSMFWKLFGMYLLYFYTDVFGIEATLVGTMFLITRVWDSLLDPFIGVMADRTGSRWGKFRPYILWLTVPFGIIGSFLFFTPDFSDTGKLVYAYVTYSLMMVIYSLINVPYASLLGVMSPDPKMRTQLSSYRMIFAFIGSILVLALVEPLVDFFSKIGGKGGDLQTGWHMSAIVFAIIAVALFLCCFLWTKERVMPIKEQKNALKDDIKDLFKNKPWWILLVAGVSAQIFNSIRDGAAVYYFKYYIDSANTFSLGFIDASWSLVTVYLVLGQLFNIVGILFVIPISNKIGKKMTYFYAMLFATIFNIIFFFAGKTDIILVMTLQALISMCAGSVFPLLWSMYADIADYSEFRTGRRATGLIFSSSSMSQKFGWSIGGALTGWLLGYFGFQANVIQTEDVQHGIRLMLSLLPAVGTVLSVIFIVLYPLSDKKVLEITKELEKERSDG